MLMYVERCVSLFCVWRVLSAFQVECNILKIDFGKVGLHCDLQIVITKNFANAFLNFSYLLRGFLDGWQAVIAIKTDTISIRGGEGWGVTGSWLYHRLMYLIPPALRLCDILMIFILDFFRRRPNSPSVPPLLHVQLCKHPMLCNYRFNKSNNKITQSLDETKWRFNLSVSAHAK